MINDFDRDAIPMPCLDCGQLTKRRPARCWLCSTKWEQKRNSDPKRKAYKNPLYLAQPKEGTCWICNKPGADTRDHIVPLSVDPNSVETRPAHRSCNSGRRGQAT